ncbi:S1 family peptidase [Actinophytocola algeriensis]|uniref:Streptogrisin C n=1 Tax=Actinophytocola algeriensis TaxID=1768010 RepID=A0A7W7Q5Y5_9PSEU|nr:S1 family peptidase [Actinophytocola algeriensis]MBB4907324.1 streptogrisin C [Actinophytocola algeriensis]MBE1478807.1 streptogrisin C [Actinophytocola algeriensis]
MKRTTLVRMGSTALLTLGLALTFATPANSVPVTSDMSEIQAALQRDLGLTPQQAEVRSQQENVAWSKDKTLRIALGSDYAGSRFDAKSGKLVVDVADASRVAEVKASGALARVVEHSEAELNAVATKLAQGSAAVPKSVTGWRVDGASNAVVVSVYGNDAAATSWAKGLGADVSFEHVTERPQTFWNLIGGQAIRTSSGSRCSLGFNARSSSARYVITAGHCTNLGGTWSGSGGTIGGVSGSSFPTNDYGRITVSSSAAVQTGLVDRYSSGSDVRVTGSSAVGTGAAVCRSGSTTGWHCGSVSSTNATVCYQQGCVYQTFRTNVCAEPGDSGGSLVSSPSGSTVQAQGLTSGGSGNCRTGGTTYYQKINEALSAYGLSLVTG